jgi:hypothetical protein
MHDEAIGPELDERRVVERAHDRLQVGFDESPQLIVGDVARRDDQQPARRALQEVAVAEVAVLGNHDPVFGVGQRGELGSGVRLPVGSAVVWTLSCPASVRNRASRAGSCASTRNFTPR